MCIYIEREGYIYIYTYIVYKIYIVYMCAYIYIERERDVYIYIYIYIHIYAHMYMSNYMKSEAGLRARRPATGVEHYMMIMCGKYNYCMLSKLLLRVLNMTE